MVTFTSSREPLDYSGITWLLSCQMKGRFPVMYTKYTKKFGGLRNFTSLISASVVFQYVAYWKLYFNLEILPSIFFFVDVRFLTYICERRLTLTITSFEKFVVYYPLFWRTLHSYNRNTCNWDVLLSDAKYKSYSVLEASFGRKLLAVGSICGNLTVIDAGELPDFLLFS